MLHWSMATFIPTYSQDNPKSTGAWFRSWAWNSAPLPSQKWPLSNHKPALTPGTKDFAYRSLQRGFLAHPAPFTSPHGDTGTSSSLLYQVPQEQKWASARSWRRGSECSKEHKRLHKNLYEGLSYQPQWHILSGRKLVRSVQCVLFSSFCPSQVSHCCY